MSPRHPCPPVPAQAMDSDSDREISWEEFVQFHTSVQKSKEDSGKQQILLQPNSDGLKPTSDGLQPNSDGLKPTSDTPT